MMNPDKTTLGEFKEELFLSPNITNDLISEILQKYIEPQLEPLDEETKSKLASSITIDLLAITSTAIKDLIAQNQDLTPFMVAYHHKGNPLIWWSAKLILF